MSYAKNSIKILALGMIAAAVATGCAAKKGPGGAPGAAAGAADSYTVAKGDCLWCISGMERIYGNPYHWPLIFKANRDKIKDADLIYPGQNLTISRNDSADEIARADKHARTRGQWSVGPVEETDKAYLAAGK